MGHYTTDELQEALRRPIASLISKSEKAQQRLSPGTWQHKTEKAQAKFAPGTSQHTLLQDRLKALRMAEALIRRESAEG